MCDAPTERNIHFRNRYGLSVTFALILYIGVHRCSLLLPHTSVLQLPKLLSRGAAWPQLLFSNGTSGIETGQSIFFSHPLEFMLSFNPIPFSFYAT